MSRSSVLRMVYGSRAFSIKTLSALVRNERADLAGVSKNHVCTITHHSRRGYDRSVLSGPRALASVIKRRLRSQNLRVWPLAVVTV